MRPPEPTARHATRAVAAIFLLGLAISALMVARSQVGGDQLNLLARGWLLAEEGRFISYGNPMSTGGKAPGGITTLLVGLPLEVWQDHRAPNVLTLLFHVAAFWILDASLKRALRPRERVLFALLYWLNPWRAYFSGFLWNPNWMFLFGAVHFATAFRQRERPGFGASFLHGAALALAFQVHASFLLLAVASALLWWRRGMRVHWGGGLLGGALAALPLVPWAIDLAHQPEILTEADKGFLGRGLLLVFPLLRGLLYWLRYASLAVSEKVAAFHFGDFLEGGSRLEGLGPALTVAAEVVLPATILLPLLANLWLYRRNRRRWRRPLTAWRGSGEPLAARTWLHGYVLASFAAVVVVFSLSPTTVMYWQALVVLHAAVLPVVLWAGALARTRRARQVRRGMWACAAAEAALLLALALGGLHYRCAGHTGRDSFGFPLRADHPMLHELGIHRTCPWPVGHPEGWWPDVLPEPERP